MKLQSILEYHCDLRSVIDLGQVPTGNRIIVDITGGTFEGARLRGTVHPTGGDWLLLGPDGLGRLDVRLTRRYHTSRGDVRLFLEFINLANRENVFAYDYEKDIAADGTPFLARESESWFPLLPSIGMNWAW